MSLLCGTDLVSFSPLLLSPLYAIYSLHHARVHFVLYVTSMLSNCLSNYQTHHGHLLLQVIHPGGFLGRLGFGHFF